MPSTDTASPKLPDNLAALAALFLLLVMVGLPQAVVSAPADTAYPPPIREWQKLLDEAEKELAYPALSDERLQGLRDQLAALESRAKASRTAAGEQAAIVRRDLEALGPPPAEGTPPEAPAVVQRRKGINEQIAAAEGSVKEADLLITRTERAGETIKQLRRNRFTEQIFTRYQSPVSQAVWSKAMPELAAIGASVAGAVGEWLTALFTGKGEGAVGQRLALGIAIALLLAFPVRLWLKRHFDETNRVTEPGYLQRVRMAMVTGMLRVWLPSMAVLALYLSLTYDGGLSAANTLLATESLTAAVAFFTVASLCHAALSPDQPHWRLVPLHDEGARSLSGVVTGLAALFSVDHIITSELVLQDVSLEAIAVQKFLFGVLVSLVLARLLRYRVWCAAGQLRVRGGWRLARQFLILLVAAIPISALLGYVVMSRLLATHLVLSVALYALVLLLLRVGQESIVQALAERSRPGRYLRRHLALSDEAVEMAAFWLASFFSLSVRTAGLLAFLFIWNLDRRDFLARLGSAFLGFRIGDITVSPADILLGLFLFALLLTGTRLLQRALDRHIFPRTRLDPGLRHSIRSGVGYAGFTLAAMLGVSTMGVNFSNLAIIAGALSVGIGFGLQNIVNNFVSGLILLIERPIKTGDFVVVGDHQGHIKKISVRATELLTSDRASVFIPNSSLISGAVMNRTYADKVGRVVIPVGVAYESDPVDARRVLIGIAESHPDVRPLPAPTVFMCGFGDSSLNLELVAFVHDVDTVKSVTSDLCFAIHDAFRRQAIQISYPHRDLRLSLDDEQLKRIFEGGRAVG